MQTNLYFVFGLREKSRWTKILRTFHEVSDIKFSRSTKPKQAVDSPKMEGYFDSPDDAYAAVIYLRSVLEDGNLTCSKTKVAPLKHISTPRSELNGAVLLSRLLLFYIKFCNKGNLKPSKIWILGDSKCTLVSNTY